MKFKVFYGVSIKYETDTWLHEELSRYGDTTVVNVSDFWLHVRRWRPRSIWGQFLQVFIAVCQSIILLVNTEKTDIIVTRSHAVGLIFMFIVNVLHINRRLVSYNWIDIPKRRYAKLARMALNKDNFIPIMNDEKIIGVIRKKLNLNNEMLGVYIPDTYDTKDEFLTPVYKEEKYVFSGGINNRDWGILLQTALLNPQIEFRLVVNKYLWKYDSVPANVKIYFDLPIYEYNAMMRKAYICVVPLKEDRVSGLINIIKSHQYGIPCVTALMDCTEKYYPLNLRPMYLYRVGDVDALSEKIQNLYMLEKSEYLKATLKLQEYLKIEFSPRKLVKRLIEYLQEKSWITDDEKYG
ncbi:hypothetical protein SAMN04487861_1024 [Selenomonas ruminantium]|uniref:Uncharacterized protein n=1 Tax=Selenomonas ruminantium TaxID=971 RepID=A0A1I3BY26_SELRU|nr:hypothetical protein [Selenomonas ruminantium]SFH67113.1 hypothetical protein SAMN04487861_1024 [Selenomonas ruminantium]